MNNLPPGCSGNDIDSSNAEAWDATIDELASIDIDPVLMVRLVKAIAPWVQKEIAAAYRQGVQDGALDHEHYNLD